MNLLRLSALFAAPALLASVALACGEITDPTQNGEKVATVSGALTGTSVPAGARVAVVWRNGQNGGRVVGAEADIVNGQFSMNLTAPPDAYFFSASSSDYDSLNGSNPPPNVATPEPAPDTTEEDGTDPGGPGSSTSGSGGANVQAKMKMGTRTNVSGGITEPLSVAIAGFVVYVDANGNGKLDLDGEYSASPDTILGGNRELLLTYLKGGGQLDYEKLRDKSGILPAAGYNLAWTEGRWLPLTLVELQLTSNTNLPGPVCNSYGGTFGSGGSGGIAETEPRPSAGPTDPNTTTPPPAGGYPPKGDPGVHCYDDGRSFYYTGDCPPPPPKPVGLCAYGYDEVSVACASPSYTFAGDTPPADWPCTYTGPVGGGSTSSTSGGGGPIDGGPAPDAGGS